MADASCARYYGNVRHVTGAFSSCDRLRNWPALPVVGRRGCNAFDGRKGGPSSAAAEQQRLRLTPESYS